MKGLRTVVLVAIMAILVLAMSTSVAMALTLLPAKDIAIYSFDGGGYTQYGPTWTNQDYHADWTYITMTYVGEPWPTEPEDFWSIHKQAWHIPGDLSKTRFDPSMNGRAWQLSIWKFSSEAMPTVSQVATITTPILRVSTETSIYASRYSCPIGGQFNLLGSCRLDPWIPNQIPTIVGQVMHVDVKKPGKTYWSYSSNRVIYGVQSWWYRYTLKRGMARGTYQFRAVYPGDAAHFPSTSRIIKVVAS